VLLEGFGRQPFKIPVLSIGPKEAYVAIQDQVSDLWTPTTSSKLMLELGSLTLAQQMSCSTRVPKKQDRFHTKQSSTQHVLEATGYFQADFPSSIMPR